MGFFLMVEYSLTTARFSFYPFVGHEMGHHLNDVYHKDNFVFCDKAGNKACYS